jgi:hypothetical protein
MMHDRRLTPARTDLADEALEGLIRADRFVAAKSMRVVAPRAAILSAPSAAAEQVDQLLFGETFAALEIMGGFAWGQAARDGYVGWVAAEALTRERLEPTHRIRALRTFAFAEASIKAAAQGPFSLNALVTVVEVEGRLARVADAGWMPVAHLSPIGAAFVDPTETALGFLGSPYLWGGRDSLGLDCSGLVQAALQAAGRACPRDTDLQAGLGRPIPAEAARRGDLVFWRGHVGMLVSETALIHANAHHMAVAIEPLAEAIERISDSGGGEPTAYRRL